MIQNTNLRWLIVAILALTVPAIRKAKCSTVQRVRCFLLLKSLSETTLEETQTKLCLASTTFSLSIGARVVQSLSGKCLLPSPPVICDYGFGNMQLYHRNVRWGPSGLTAEDIWLALFQTMVKDIDCDERGDTKHVLNSFGASKRMILDAYERNSLDEFVQRYIRNVLERYSGMPEPGVQYCHAWMENKLIVGPTRLLDLTYPGQEVKMRSEVCHKYYE